MDKKNLLDLPRLPSPHGYKASFGDEGGSLPPHLTHRNTSSFLLLKPNPLLQNPSEASDEELNDDLLQSDDEDINAR